MSGAIDASNGLLQAIWEHFDLVLLPALRQSQKWGTVPHAAVSKFLGSLDIVEFLKSEL